MYNNTFSIMIYIIDWSYKSPFVSYEYNKLYCQEKDEAIKHSTIRLVI